MKQTVEERLKKIEVVVDKRNNEVMNLYNWLNFEQRKAVLDFIQSEIKANNKEIIEIIKKETLKSGIPKSNFYGINWIGQDNLIQAIKKLKEKL